MATKLFMKQPINSFLTSYGYMNPTASVLAFTTSVTNTTASGTSIQCTKTAAGTALKWISPELSAPVTIAGTITLNCWAKEGAISANAGMKATVSKYSAGAEGAAFATASKGVELTTSMAVQNFTATPTSTAFLPGDRIVVTWFVANVGTMGAGTVTMDYGGKTGAADGDTWVSFTETITFKAEPEFIQGIYSNAGGTGASATLTFPGATKAGNMIFAWAAWADQTNTLSIADSQAGGNYTSCRASQNYTQNSVASSIQAFYKANIIGGASTIVTFTWSGAASQRADGAEEWAGLNTTAPFDVANSGSGLASGTDTVTSGTMTPSVAYSVLIGCCDIDNSGTTAGTGFVLRLTTTDDKTFTSITTSAALFTIGTGNYGCVGVFFKSAYQTIFTPGPHTIVAGYRRSMILGY